MDDNSIALTVLKTGEMYDTGIKQNDTKFIVKGRKMYNNGIEHLVDVLTKRELKVVLALCKGAKTIDRFNILTQPFRAYTTGWDPSDRSKLKRKLLQESILGAYGGKLMVNPFVFVPNGTKDITNCNHLTQQVWKYVFEDCDIGSPSIIEHAEHIFGKAFNQSDFLLVGSSDHQTVLRKPDVS